ncbi:MAG: valine--tRNA ligase [Chloroflexota bacterium]
MSDLPKKYKPQEAEARIQQFWADNGVFTFDRDDDTRPIYAIDTPPPTVSGELHLGHVYSYSQAEFMARFWRMRGYNVYYPMGYDDNGLPTERLVEQHRKIRAQDVGRQAFIDACLATSHDIEAQYEQLWQRLGLSVDWNYTYSTINTESRRIAQWSFLDLYRKGLVYRASAPTIWNPIMKTAIAQAELADLERETRFLTIRFRLANGETLPIATTRPELLPACVAIFVHPEDERYRSLIGDTANTPLFEKSVPILADEKADPSKGSGVVMCCTFGDVTDIDWWREHKLPLVRLIEPDGRLNEQGGDYAGLTTKQARERIIADLQTAGLIIDEQTVTQSIRVHERDDTPVEYIETKQWFIKVLEHKERLLEAGRTIQWIPQEMQDRYENWVQGLSWDWAISRQRYFGVPFPVWYCQQCGETIVADESQLPVDPSITQPDHPCPQCDSTSFTPETDVMDTWATSSNTPQIAGRWLADPDLYQKVFPMSLRPQAHDIIRTWAFYTIVKSLYHFDTLPWNTVAISGHGLRAGQTKLSKSRNNAKFSPEAVIDQFSADAIRHWAAGAGFGRDSLISEEQFRIGKKLVTKLWNVFRFCHRFLVDYQPTNEPPSSLTPTDRWILARLGQTIPEVTTQFESNQFAKAKSTAEHFFWNELADNYIEMAKQRLYGTDDPKEQEAAQYTLYHAMQSVIKLLAPIIPHITEEIYQHYFKQYNGAPSIHCSVWPQSLTTWQQADAQYFGENLVAIAGAVRRYKSEHQLPLGAELAQLSLQTNDDQLRTALNDSWGDLQSVTRAKKIVFLQGQEGTSLISVSDCIQMEIVAMSTTEMRD